MKYPTTAAPPVGSLAARVFQIVAEEAEQPFEWIDRETNLGVVFDSLGLVELIMALEDEFEIAIPDDAAQKIQTVGQLVDAIEARLAARAGGGPPDAGHAPPGP